jgi:hypothetical protein
MFGNQQFELNDRKYVKHPESIQIMIEELADTDDISPISHDTCHGLIFNYTCYIQPNKKIKINIKLDDMLFSGNAVVTSCRKVNKGYEIKTEFLSSCEEFKVKMALQVCQIKDFMTSKHQNQEDNETALKWIDLNAAKF